MGSGFKDFTAEVHTSADVDGYLMQQSIMVFADATDRDAQLVPSATTNGMFAYMLDDGRVLVVTDDTLEDGGWQMFSSPAYNYTPTWNNLTIGSSAVVASYAWRPGRILHCWGQVTLAADASVTGNFQHIIPLGHTASAKGATGTALLNDVGTRIYTGLVHCIPSSTAFDFHHADSSGGGTAGTTAPFTWTTNDVFTWDIQILVA